jgi:iron(III) transport system substrate-binding protein
LQKTSRRLRFGAAFSLSALAGAALALGAPGRALAADQALIDAAKKEGQVVWYTVQIVSQVVRPLAAGFEKKYGIHVSYVRANSHEVVLRVLAEAEADQNFSDVFDGTSTAPALKKKGLVLKWVPDSVKKWPKHLVDEDGYWAASNLFVNSIGINTELVTGKHVPKQWEDLLDPWWKGKLAWGSTASSSAGPGFVGLMIRSRGEEAAMDFLKKLSKQDVAGMPVSARKVLDQVIAGEYAAGLMIFNHHTIISGDKGAPVKWLPLSPASVTLNTASVAAHAPHPNAAKLFLDYMLSDEGQKVFRESNYLPANPHVKAKHPELIPDGETYKGVTFSPEYIDAHMGKWVDIFHKIFG